MRRYRLDLICLFLFVLALALRLVGLGSFLTPDENLWATRITQFLAGISAKNWAATNVTGHPGVTTMWAGSLGLIAKWLFARSPIAPNFLASLSELAADPVRLDYLPWLRFPVAVACAAAIVVVYLLARRLMDERTALLGAGLLVFDPFLLAHGRVLQMDGLLTAGISVAWLALLLALRTGQRRFYLLSGLSIGVAVLTKSPALVMGPLMLGVIVLVRMRQQGPLGARLGRSVVDLLWTGIPAAIAIFLLWPALWAQPLATLKSVWELMTAYGGEAHEVGSFWLGKPMPDPGALFYVATLVLRTTPVTLVGLLLALPASFLRREIAPAGAGTDADAAPAQCRRAAWGLLALVIWFGLIMTVGAKKLDRYLLPIFPAVDLLAAWGWMSALRWAAGRLRQPASGPRTGQAPSRPLAAAMWAGAALLVGVQAWSALAERPSYLTAYNALAGGARTAARVFPVGWGEGLEEAAAYLNGLPGAETGHVAAWYGTNVFAAFYRGTTFNLQYRTSDTPISTGLYTYDMDWVVTYINQEQRGLVDPSVAARLGAPLHTVARDGVTLARVYAWPKPFAHTSDLPVGPGLRLLGWQAGEHDRRTGALPVTLYWDATAAATVPGQRVVIWIKDDAGEVWATAEETVGTDSRTGAAAPQAAGWSDQPVVVQAFTLRPPIGLSPGAYRIEIAPFAGISTGLTALEIGATRLSEIASLGPRTIVPPGEVRFGDVARLVGFDLDTTGVSWTVDLVWAWLASPGESYHYFIHVVDASNAIVAQQDDTLAQTGGPGDLARQRVHVALPHGTPATYRVYVGLYRRQDSTRLPLIINGQPAPDNRYLLATGP